MENSLLGNGLFFGGVLFVLLSALIVALNWHALYTNHRNKKRGKDKHASMIFLVPQILLSLANIVFQNVPVYPVSGWLLLCLALLDPAIWFLASAPLVMWLKK